MNSKLLNAIEIFNELTLLICSYFMFLFTDFIKDAEFRYHLGWYFIRVIIFNIICKLGVLIMKIVQAIKEILLKRRQKVSRKKNENN